MYSKIVKRGLDILFATLLVVIASPIMLLCALLIKIREPKESVLFKQQRPGLDEKVFTIYKFRTMRVTAVDELGKELTDAERMTGIGGVLRKLSLDELPQLFNIIRGDMSFIGPRPLLVVYLEYYNTEQKRRHSVRPGISGWAQVNGRNTISWEDKFSLDVWYVDHISFMIDCRIVCMTIINVLKKKDINHTTDCTMPFFEGSS